MDTVLRMLSPFESVQDPNLSYGVTRIWGRSFRAQLHVPGNTLGHAKPVELTWRLSYRDW